MRYLSTINAWVRCVIIGGWMGVLWAIPFLAMCILLLYAILAGPWWLTYIPMAYIMGVFIGHAHEQWLQRQHDHTDEDGP